jgi:hypothetical protein
VTTPERLRARVTRDLRPVRPHLTAWQRTIVLLPAVLLAFAAAPGALGVRGDFATVGPLLAWGGSLLQLAVAVALIVAALREAVPGFIVSGTSVRLLAALAAMVVIALTLATSAASPERGGRVETLYDWYFCWRGVVLAGLPLLLAMLVLLVRGLMMRPALAGALAGLGAGAAVDGGWRLYCNYSNPSHVLGSHGGGIMALTVLGVVGAVTLAHLRQRSRQEDP